MTVARQIDFVFEKLWGKVILSGLHPIGQILNYDLRKELQSRGTAHFHSALHVKDAPKIGVDPDDDVTHFIDKYVKCNIPNKADDPDLYELVTSRQNHNHL